MKSIIHHGGMSMHRQKGVGSNVTVHFDREHAGERSGVYEFGSHGMTAEEFHARIAELKAYHRAKVDRLNGFATLRMRDIVVDGAKYRIIDANLSERGSDVELRLNVYSIGPLGHQHFAFSLGHMQGLIFPSIEAVPDDDAIETIVRRRIADLANLTSIHDSFKAAVSAAVEA